MKSFIINLPKDTDRLGSITTQFEEQNIPYEVLEAVYGRELPEAELHRLTTEVGRKRLSLSEIGCALSHLKAYQTIIDQNLPMALIVEDDARLGAHCSAVLEELEKHVDGSDPAVVLLSVARAYRNFLKTPLVDDYCVTQAFEASLTHGYVVTQEAARRLLKVLSPVYLEADIWRVICSLANVRLQAVIPYCIGLTNLANDSNIHHSTPCEQDLKQNRQIYSIGMPFYRKWYWSALKLLGLYGRQSEDMSQ